MGCNIRDSCNVSTLAGNHPHLDSDSSNSDVEAIPVCVFHCNFSFCNSQTGFGFNPLILQRRLKD